MDLARCGQFCVLRKLGWQPHPQLHLQTPATCSNIALHNLFPGEIDLVVSVCLSAVRAATPIPHALIRFLGRILGETRLVRIAPLVTMLRTG